MGATDDRDARLFSPPHWTDGKPVSHESDAYPQSKGETVTVTKEAAAAARAAPPNEVTLLEWAKVLVVQDVEIKDVEGRIRDCEEELKRLLETRATAYEVLKRADLSGDRTEGLAIRVEDRVVHVANRSGVTTVRVVPMVG